MLCKKIYLMCQKINQSAEIVRKILFNLHIHIE